MIWFTLVELGGLYASPTIILYVYNIWNLGEDLVPVKSI